MENHSKLLAAKLDTVVPPLTEVSNVILRFMKDYYADVSVDVCETPDFTKAPYMMTAPNIGSSLRIAEVGGNSNLYPTPKTNVYYNLKELCETCEMSDGFIFGPGGGPRHIVGTNCEMVADCCFNEPQEKVAIKMGVITGKADKEHEMVVTDKPEFCLMANLGVCNGAVPADVLRVRVRKRIGSLNFPECIRQAIAQHYGNAVVSCAGIFLVKTGKVKIHVMPDFPPCSFGSTDEVTQWLKFFEIEAPIVCTSVFHSKDVEDFKLRLEHTHCYNGHEAGHYHYDTTPDEVEYEGYFALASKIYRVDIA